MEIPHTDFTEVTRVELVEVRTVVVLTTSHTTTTGVLPVLANTTVTGRDVAAARRSRKKELVAILEGAIVWCVLDYSGAESTSVGRAQGCGRCCPSGNGVNERKYSLLAGLGQSGRHLVGGAVFDKIWSMVESWRLR